MEETKGTKLNIQQKPEYPNNHFMVTPTTCELVVTTNHWSKQNSRGPYKNMNTVAFCSI